MNYRKQNYTATNYFVKFIMSWCLLSADVSDIGQVYYVMVYAKCRRLKTSAKLYLANQTWLINLSILFMASLSLSKPVAYDILI